MGDVFWYHYGQGPEAKPDRWEEIHGQDGAAGGLRDDARYMCDDGKVHTWREMTADPEHDAYPSCKYDVRRVLMFCFGAEPIPA